MASIPSEIFKKKGEEIKNFRTKYTLKYKNKIIIEPKTSICDYLKDDYFTKLGTWVSGLKIVEITVSGAQQKVVQDSNNNNVDKNLLLKMKHEGFHQILTEMVKSNASTNGFKDGIKAAFGYGNNSMAYYSGDDGKLPDLSTLSGDAWNDFIDNFKEISFDDNKFAEFMNKFLLKVDETLMDSLFTDTKAGVEGIFTEWSSLSTETQGNIYLTSKGQGTAKLNGTTLQSSNAIPSKFKDIMESFKKPVS